MSLNAEQQRLFDIVTKERASVYFGGGAGTGKTHTTQAMVDALRDNGLNVVVCAPTGQAAQHLEGDTIHMLFGLMPAREPGGPCTQPRMWRLQETLRAADVIFIDEISMASEELFESMNRRMQRLKRNEKPMGGVQTVALGDFCQLPPVGDRHKPDGRFCFHSPHFHALFGQHMYRLTQQMRQADDVPFAQLLERLRVCNGDLGPEDVALLRTRLYVPAPRPFSDEPYLFARRNDGSAHNTICAGMLGASAPAYEWTAKDWVADEECRRALSTMRADEKLELRVGAPVLLRFNLDRAARLVNGTRGIVRAIVPMCELGLRACGKCEVCNGDVPRPQHSFVSLIGTLPTDPRVPIPLVEMMCGDSSFVYAVGMHRQEKLWPLRTGAKRGRPGADAAAGSIMCSRTQIPLTLAWAFTMHKAQGMTMPKVCISIDRLFEDGQFYVALSRAQRLSDVRIIGNYIPVKRICASADAVRFERDYLHPLL